MNKWTMVALLALTGVSRAQELSLESAGARFGFPESDSAYHFHQAEAFGNVNLPWRWYLGPKCFLQTRLDTSAGWLGDKGDNAFVGTAGPTLVLGRESFPLSLEGGVSPTILSRYEFADRNFGCLFQFTSHIGLNFDLNGHWRLSYRFQHMSNAGFVHPNPGLNMHMVGASYRF